MSWEQKAKILYQYTKWEKAAIAAGKAMDNRLDHVAIGPYGFRGEGSHFDMLQYLAFFDYEILVRRGLSSKIPLSL